MAILYWIHLPEHNDISCQGYIGVTNRSLEYRYKKHKERSKNIKRSGKLGEIIRAYNKQLIMVPLCFSTYEYCLDIENKLRPKFNIGWNQGVGGSKPTLGRKCSLEEKIHFSKVHSGRAHTEEWKKMMSEKFKGRKFRLGGKMPESAKEAIRNAKGICQYCNREMTLPMIARWHGEKCPAR